jgi:hypothetical protein
LLSILFIYLLLAIGAVLLTLASLAEAQGASSKHARDEDFDLAFITWILFSTLAIIVNILPGNSLGAIALYITLSPVSVLIPP